MKFRYFIAALLLTLSCVGARAQRAEDLTVLLVIQDDGSAVAVERLQLAGAMTKPVRWKFRTSASAAGISHHLYVDLLEVTDGDNVHLKHTTRNDGEFLSVEVPPQPLGNSTLRLSYDVRNAVRFHGDHDELLWQVENGWSLPPENVEVNVGVPPAAQGHFTGRAITAGVARPLSVQQEFATWSSEGGDATHLPIIDGAFPSGILREPSPLTRLSWFLEANPVVFLPLVVFGVMWCLRRLTTKKQDVTVQTRYEPPEGLTPAEVGFLIDDELQPCDISATLLDLAVRGYIRIEDGKPDEGVPFVGQDFVLRLLKPMNEWAGLAPFEELLMFHTFYGGQWTKLSSLSLRFYSVVPMIERQIRLAVESRGLYVDPRRTQAVHQSIVIVAAVILWIAQAAGLFSLVQSDLVAAVALVVSVAIVFLYSRNVSHRSSHGEEVFAEIRGFQDYMNTVEGDRMERLTPGLMEKYLPYAVALGVEHHWSETFAAMSAGPPLWWGETGEPPNLAGVLRRVGWFSHAAKVVAQHAPRGNTSQPRPAPPSVQNSAHGATPLHTA